MSAPAFKSAIYEGWVSHHRLQPHAHYFRYQVFMMYLDLAELEMLFKDSWFWSLERSNLACFRRSDYFGDAGQPLDVAVRDRIENETGRRPLGPVRVLTNLRYFGYITNPISCYYCFDEEERLQYILAEVTNTPWGERHAYVIPCGNDGSVQDWHFAKAHHVSPFMPMDMHYRWHSNVPGRNLHLNLQSYRQEKAFSASLHLQRHELKPARLNLLLLRYPFMTMKVISAIYWQALKLWWKKTPFYPHPESPRS